MTGNPQNTPTPPTPEEIKAFCNAAQYGEMDGVTEYIQKYPAFLNAQDSIDARALTWAAFAGQAEVITLLLDAGADINAKGTGGKTPIAWAADMGQYSAAELLIARGADLTLKDDVGETPVTLARFKGYTAIADLIEGHFQGEQQKVEDQKERDAEAAARAVTAERLEKLKSLHPEKFGFRKQPQKPVIRRNPRP
jgi:hypothetical protein